MTLLRDNQHIRASSGEYYYTDAIAQNAAVTSTSTAARTCPSFSMCAFTSPHWPLQAPEEDDRQIPRPLQAGWDVTARERHKRMIGMGIIDRKWPLSPRDPRVPAWTLARDKDMAARRMEVYAAQIDRMDQDIGRILEKLQGTAECSTTR